MAALQKNKYQIYLIDMKIKGQNIYYALLCDCSEKGRKDLLLCGVYASKREAQKANKGDCPAKHLIKKCKVTIEI